MRIHILPGAALCLILLATVGQIANAQSQPTLDFLFGGVREERARLKSGICKIEGTATTRSLRNSGSKRASVQGESDDSFEELSERCSYFIAFDGAEYYRFDRSQPGLIRDRSAAVATTENALASNEPDRTLKPVEGLRPLDGLVSFKRGQKATKFATNPEKAAWWNSESRSIDLMHPASVQLGYTHGFFDIRCLGLCSLHTLTAKSVRLEDYLRDKLSTLKKRSQEGAVQIHSTDANVYQVILQHDNPTKSEWLMDIAVDRGFSATRSLIRKKYGDNSSEWLNKEDINVSWELINGVWLPVELKAIQLDANTAWSATREPIKEVSWNLQWSNVNEEIDKSLFSHESFGAKESVDIVDVSNRSRPILVREGVSEPQHDGLSFFQWSMLVSLLAVIVGGVFAWVRWRSR